MDRIIQLFWLGIIVIFGCVSEEQGPKEVPQTGAARALDQWSLARTYPYDKIYMGKYHKAFQIKKEALETRDQSAVLSNWEPMGPKNIGGRTLCLGFHPKNPKIIYAGSASGGLWKTETGGKSSLNNGNLQFAWERVELGFPVLSVSAIAINPKNENEIYIGTGEVYNKEIAMPGIYDRFTRGTYGIGILKSEDGGSTWRKSLDWSLTDMRGIQDIVINPQNPNTLWAATTEGLFRSYDAGHSWQVIQTIPMAIDVEINPGDTNIVYVSYGSYLNQETSGIYRTLDGGWTFDQLTNGLPKKYSGRAVIKASEIDPTTLYIYVSNATKGLGLYLSTDAGDTWTLKNEKDITKWQGWYSADIAIHPEDPNTLVVTGVDVYRSSNQGKTIAHTSTWEGFHRGKIEVLKEEGIRSYVHADIHKAYYHPLLDDVVYFATDGGIFVSENGGITFSGRNGGYQTTQFYANFSNSTTNPFFAIGGMQDNATAIYDGTFEWIKVLGGDGMSTAIHPVDDNIIFGSLQFFGLNKSMDGGKSWKYIKPSELGKDKVSFNTPYEMTALDPNVLYAGGQRLYISEDGGYTWRATSNENVNGKSSIINIAVAPSDPTLIYLSTSPAEDTSPKVLKSSGGENWTTMEGLPNRLAMDIAVHPEDSRIVYIVFSGYNTQHVYKTLDGGLSWDPIDTGLPDVPANTVFLDPLEPNHVYIGTDLGVYLSLDGGSSWTDYNQGLPEAIMAMHLSISPSNRKLRIATHGSGVYQSDLALETVGTKQLANHLIELRQNYPNPVTDVTTFEFTVKNPAKVNLTLINGLGQTVKSLLTNTPVTNEYRVTQNLTELASGQYWYVLEGFTSGNQRFRKTLPLVKQ